MLSILTQSFWRDEIHSVFIAQKSPIEIFQVLLINDAHFPLYFYILSFWIKLFGSDEISVRTLSAIFHIALLFTVFFITRRVLRKNILAMLATIAVGLNPFLLNYAFEARMYSLLAFLGSLALLSFLNSWSILFSLILILILYTHPMGFLIYLGFMLFIFFSKVYLREEIRRSTIIVSLIPLVFWLPLVIISWRQVGVVLKDFWVADVTSDVFLKTFKSFTTGIFDYKSRSALLNITILLSIFSFSFLITKPQQFAKEKQLISLFLIVSLVPIIGTFIFSWFGRSIYIDRLFIASLPVLFILLGFSLNKFYNYSDEIFKRIIIVILAIFFLYEFQAARDVLRSETKPPIRDAVFQVSSMMRDGDLVVSESILNYLETKYYFEKTTINPTLLYLEPKGELPFYTAPYLFEKEGLVTKLPKERFWLIKRDGSFEFFPSPP